MFKALDLRNVDSSEVRFLWEDTAHEAGGILDGALLPAVVGFTEVGCGTEDRIDFPVLKVFMAVVVGDRSPCRLWIPC